MVAKECENRSFFEFLIFLYLLKSKNKYIVRYIRDMVV
jgi:hypothetical protein